MKNIIKIILFAAFLPAMVFAQSSSNISDLLSKAKGQYLKLNQKSLLSLTYVKQDQAEKLISSTVASETPFYTGRYSNESAGLYSSTLEKPEESSTIVNWGGDYLLLADGTMDNKGNWWAITNNIYWWGGWGRPGSNDPSLQNNLKGGPPPDVATILKIDKSNGAINKVIPMPFNKAYLGIAFNPIDKLIYFLGEDINDDDGTILSKISNGNGLAKAHHNMTFLYSLNPVTYEINVVSVYDGILVGLACSNEGIFYSVYFNGDDEMVLAKYTAGSSNVTFIGSTILSNDFTPFPFFIDLEIDPNTNKCYLQTTDFTLELSAQIREVNLTSGSTSEFYKFGNGGLFVSGGLAFDDKITVVPPNTGRYLITSPNGGEKLIGGATPFITWKKTTPVVLGTVQLEYSTNSGVSWTKINNTQIIGVTRYPWKVPQVNSAHCLVRIVNYLSKTEIDRSDKEFTISTTTQPVSANYPNPFNPSTKISFRLEKAALTSLKVYNSIGQQVAELVNKQLEAGTHEFEFNASKLPSGVYFYNLTSDGKSEVRKMLLMK